MGEISRPYQDELLKALADPLEAVAYLNAALDDGSNELFLLALQNVIAAQRLREKSPADVKLQLANLGTILSNLGFRFTPKANQSISV